MKKRHYNYQDREFILEPLSDSLVKVTHRDQTGYLGMNTEWDARNPFAWTKWRDQTSDDGVNDGFWSYRQSPGIAVRYITVGPEQRGFQADQS